MKKSQRIKTIVEIKADQEKAALEKLGMTQRKLLTLQGQIDGLKNYRQEYQQRFDQLCSRGTHVSQLLEFRSFIDKLDKAILGQEQILTGIEAELRIKRKQWEDLHNKTQSLQKACDAALATEIKQEIKREQREQDERATRIGRSGMGDA